MKMPVVTSDGVDISYHIVGEGVPIVLIPPPVVGPSVFRHQVDALSSEFKIIAVELREGVEPSPGTRFTYSVIAHDIRAILDHAGVDKAVICGYSMAGSIVFEFMRTYPERTLGGIPISGFSEASDVRIRTEISTAVMFAKAGAMRTLAFGLSLVNADSLQSFQSMFRHGLCCNRRSVRDLFQYALHYKCTQHLPSLKQPLRLVFGAKDRRLYRYVKILKARLPNKDIVFIPKARHQIPLKNAQELNQQIRDFVRGLH